MKSNTQASPHIRGPFTTRRIMLDVLIALLPALAVGIFRFGVRALVVTLVSVVTAVASESLFCLLVKKKNTASDLSAAVTGLLLAVTLPHTVPYWLAALGATFAVLAIKMPLGGLGQNVFNPALAARAFLVLIAPASLTRYMTVDGVSSATPLHHMVMPALPEESILDMFLGVCPGSIGEISAAALLVGFVYLLVRRVISLRIPLCFIGTVALLTLVFYKTGAPLAWMAYSVFSGGLMLGAIFMATDYTTSPVTPVGQILYGIGCGALTVVFRYFGLFPEGITYAILLMNALAWGIDRITPPRQFGTKRRGGEAS